MNWEKNFKTKSEAIVHIFDCLAQNHGVADDSGTLGVMYDGQMIIIRPPKKKKEQYA